MTWTDIMMALERAVFVIVGADGGSLTWWQMTVRALLLFLYGVMLVRIAGPRMFGHSAVIDLILTVLIGSNLSRALTGNAPLFPTMVATAAMVFIHWLLARLAFRYNWISWLVKGHRVQLVRRGEIDWVAMRSNAIADGDLLDAAREAGVHELDEIEEASLQRNGKIIVTRRR